MRGADGGQRILLDIFEVGAEALLADNRAVLEGKEPPLAQLTLAELQGEVTLEHLERDPGRGEEDAVTALADPQRAAFREWAATAKIASESTVILGSARAQEWGASSSSSFVMIPLWIPTTGPWRTGWLFAAIDGW